MDVFHFYNLEFNFNKITLTIENTQTLKNEMNVRLQPLTSSQVEYSLHINL